MPQILTILFDVASQLVFLVLSPSICIGAYIIVAAIPVPMCVNSGNEIPD